MTVAVYQCPDDFNLGIPISGSPYLARVRALEFFTVDDADTDAVDALEAAGFDIGEHEPNEEHTPWGSANTLTPHNPFLVAEV